jgi:hypothetical protein
VVQQPGAPFAPTPAPARRRTGLMAVGALVLAAGVAAGIVMIMASGTNYDDAVQNMARAPIGCTTSLRFDETGTFTVYVETEGSIGEVRGDCPNTDTDYRYRGDRLPDVELSLTDDGGDEVRLQDEFDTSYDAAGAKGQSIGTVDIEKAGDYALTVTSDAEDFAIAIGKNPKQDASSLRTGGLVALIAGVVLGGLMLALGLRKRNPPTAPPAPAGTVAPYGVPPATYTQPAQPAAPPAGWPPANPTPPHVPPSAPPAGPSQPPSPPMGPPNWPAPPSS